MVATWPDTALGRPKANDEGVLKRKRAASALASARGEEGLGGREGSEMIEPA